MECCLMTSNECEHVKFVSFLIHYHMNEAGDEEVTQGENVDLSRGYKQ